MASEPVPDAPSPLSGRPGFGFEIAPCAHGWRWTVRVAGRQHPLVQGMASSRSQAAAYVVRMIIRTLEAEACVSQPREPYLAAARRVAA